MKYSLDVDDQTRMFIRHLSPSRKHKIKESLRMLARNPLSGKPLEEELEGFYTYRVGDLRIVYTINWSKKLLEVVTIGPRSHVYEEIEKELLSKKED